MTKQTDGTKGEYNTEAEEALQMSGKGYELSIEIESPRQVTQRRGGKLIETESAAFVKIYTSFKQELKTLEGGDLKVWIYLALSINRYTKDARPGLRKIAEDLGMAVNTVRASVERLEYKNLLDVEQEDGKGNIYHPADYASVSKSDTPKPQQTVSKSAGTVSKNHGTVSASRRDFAQLEELDKLEKEAATPRLLSKFEIQEIEESANKTVDGILEGERLSQEKDKVGEAWRGRELCPPNYLIYGDWWHSKTKQHMYGAKGKQKINTEWLKAFKEFYENDIPISVLEETYDAEIAWKKIITKPSELTTKAIAISALPPAQSKSENNNKFDSLFSYLQKQEGAMS